MHQLLHLIIPISIAFREKLLQLIPMLLLLCSSLLTGPYSGREIPEEYRYDIPKA